MLKVLAVVALLAVAQLLPSCGGDGGSRPDVVGFVSEKRRAQQEFFPYLIVINNLEYGVPYEFWLTVEVGDLVRFAGGEWRVVRRARG
jgi:hypothetical protein